MTENNLQKGILVLADISGYTHFSRLHYTSLLHAEQIISELLESIIDTAQFPLATGHLEGDAVLLFAQVPGGREAEAARDVANQVSQFFISFNQREKMLIACDAGCVCQACQQIGDLKLKAVIHFGEYSLREIQGVKDVAGADVSLMRRLIKAPIREREHIIVTPAFFTHCQSLQDLGREEERSLQLDSLTMTVKVYFPQMNLAMLTAKPGSGPAFSARLNRHSFSRMFGLRRRPQFNSLPDDRMNLFLYLLEGIASGVNVLRKSLRRIFQRGVLVKPAALLFVDAGSESALRALLEAARPPLILNKLEGSAALLYASAEDDRFLLAEGLLRQAGNLLRASERARLVLHFGNIAFKRIGEYDEIAGLDVILAHHLMKHGGRAATILLTESFYSLLKNPPVSEVDLVDTDILGRVKVYLPG